MDITLPENLSSKKEEIQEFLDRVSKAVSSLEEGKKETPHRLFLRELNILLGQHLVPLSYNEGISITLGVALDDTDFWRAQ